MGPVSLIRWVFITALAIAATSARADNCQLKLISSLTLTETSDGLLVPITVAGKELKFILELGGAYSGIVADYTKQLALAESRMPRGVEITIEDEPIANRVSVPELQIGSLVGRDLKLLEVPKVSGADGRLALDILSQQDVELDLAHERLNLFSRDHCTGQVIYWSPPGGAVAAIPLTIQKTGHIMTTMSVDGQLLTVGITTEG